MTTDTQAVLGGCGFAPMADGRWLAVGPHRRVEARETDAGGLEVVGWAVGGAAWRNRLAPDHSIGTLRVLLAACAGWLEAALAAVEPTTPVSKRPRHARLWSALARCDSLIADHAV